MSRGFAIACRIAPLVISLKTMRLTGTLGLSSSKRCQAMASPSRSSSVARMSSSASLSSFLSLVICDFLSVGHEVERLEVVVDVDAEPRPRLALVLGRHRVALGVRQVADVADAGVHDDSRRRGSPRCCGPCSATRR